MRHGETDWNREGRLQGQRDVPINATGRSQARRNGGVLKEVLDHPNALDYVASPLLRTRETMAILRGQLELPLETFRTDERLKEINFGLWEGHSWTDLKRNETDEIKARRADPYNYVVPGGESYAMVMTRVVNWLSSIERDVVVCSHGGIMRCLRGHVADLSQKQIPHLDVPQDRVMVIEGRTLVWL